VGGPITPELLCFILILQRLLNVPGENEEEKEEEEKEFISDKRGSCRRFLESLG